MRFFSCLFIVTMFTVKLAAQVPDSVRSYVHECLDTMRSRSLYAKSVDWDSVSRVCDQRLQLAQTSLEAEAVVIDVFKLLHDVHGMYGGIDTTFRFGTAGADRELSKGLLEAYRVPRDVRTRMLEGKIAYYKMPAVLIGSDTAKMKMWANRLADSIRKLEAKHPRAYIIDLRMNNGGNFEPMWNALAGLIGKENRVSSVDRDGKTLPEDTDPESVAYHTSGMPDHPVKFRKNIPVAVLIGPGTASSGEIIAASFSTRKNTRLFGEPSVGVANVTQGAIIQNKGYLLLTVASIKNAKGKIIRDFTIHPDEYVKSEDDFVNPASDITVQAALKWLRSK